MPPPYRMFSVDGCRVDTCVHRPRSGRRCRRKDLYKFGGSEIATASVRTGFAMTIGVAVHVIARSEHPQGVRRIRNARSSRTAAQATWQSDASDERVCAQSVVPRRGDVCERRLWREERAKRSGRIKAIGERASHAMTEPLIQQNMSPPYRRFSIDICRDGACPIRSAKRQTVQTNKPVQSR